MNSFGMHDPNPVIVILTFCILLLIPIAFTFWFRHRASNATEESKSSVVFAYRRFITSMVWCGVLVWWIAIDVFHADDVIQSVLSGLLRPDDLGSFLPWLLLWVPPAAVYFVCLALSPVHLLRGVNRTLAQAMNQSFWSVARLVLPISILIAAIFEFDTSPRLAVVLLAFWILTARLVSLKAADAYGMKLHALTSGEIRDRAFALAKKGGTKLNQLFILPTEQHRLANAFAHSGRNIYLTDYLLKNLSRREVDAIMAHEVTHLQKNHVRMRVFAVILLAFAIGLFEGWPQQWIPGGIPAGPVCYGVFLIVIFFISRRNEFAADAGACKITGDAEALITGLARVSRLNTMPINWGKLDEKILTHPSTLRRMSRLARLGGMSEACIPDLLNKSQLPPADTYPLPEIVRPSGKIFSTRYKANLSWALAWLLTVSTAMVPALFVFAAQDAHLVGRPLMLVLIFGMACSFAVYLAISVFLPLRGIARIEKEVREKMKKEEAPQEIQNGVFVSLSPDSTPRIYDGNYAWDVGFLAASENRLYYWGEESRFSLPREQVTSVELGPGPVSWFKIPSVSVSWRDPEGVVRGFNLGVPASSMLGMASKTRRLRVALENWHRRISESTESILSCCAKELPSTECASLPIFREVTSVSPKLVVHGKYLARSFFLDSIVAAAVAILFGFQLSFPDSIFSAGAPQDLSSSGLGFVYILVAVWLVRAFQLWPFWRFREHKSQTVSAPVPQASSNQTSTGAFRSVPE